MKTPKCVCVVCTSHLIFRFLYPPGTCYLLSQHLTLEMTKLLLLFAIRALLTGNPIVFEKGGKSILSTVQVQNLRGTLGSFLIPHAI